MTLKSWLSGVTIQVPNIDEVFFPAVVAVADDLIDSVSGRFSSRLSRLDIVRTDSVRSLKVKSCAPSPPAGHQG